MSDQKPTTTKSALRTELEGIAVKLNELPGMVKNFGGGVLGTVVKFMGKIVDRVDVLESRLAELEKSKTDN